MLKFRQHIAFTVKTKFTSKKTKKMDLSPDNKSCFTADSNLQPKKSEIGFKSRQQVLR